MRLAEGRKRFGWKTRVAAALFGREKQRERLADMVEGCEGMVAAKVAVTAARAVERSKGVEQNPIKSAELGLPW